MYGMCAGVCACLLQAALLQAVRGYAAKDVRFGIECREAVLAGVNKLADAVQVTLGPKVRRGVELHNQQHWQVQQQVQQQ